METWALRNDSNFLSDFPAFPPPSFSLLDWTPGHSDHPIPWLLTL